MYRTITVILMTQRAADEHARRSMGIPPDCGLGWTPYTVLVLRDAGSYRAFHRARDLRRLPELRGKTLRFSPSGRGVRYARLEDA